MPPRRALLGASASGGPPSARPKVSLPPTRCPRIDLLGAGLTTPPSARPKVSVPPTRRPRIGALLNGTAKKPRRESPSSVGVRSANARPCAKAKGDSTSGRVSPTTERILRFHVGLLAPLVVLAVSCVVSATADDLFRDDFSAFPPGWLTRPVGQLNGAIQEYHYLAHRGVPLGPWAIVICHLDAWARSATKTDTPTSSSTPSTTSRS